MHQQQPFAAVNSQFAASPIHGASQPTHHEVFTSSIASKNVNTTYPVIECGVTVIKHRWLLQRKLGQGAFGETYSAMDLQAKQEYAIKIEYLTAERKHLLRLEAMTLKKLQACPAVVRYMFSGHQETYNYLVMEKLGENVASLLKQQSRFSLCTCLKLGLQMLDAIEGIHRLGYVHRDIKPSNFVMGRQAHNCNQCFLIDFGLARRFQDLSSGEIIPPRAQIGFRGTARYASMYSHYGKELGRRDDLWSLFYMLVEFASGTLPWRRIRDKAHVGTLKQQLMTGAPQQELVKNLPIEFFQFMEHLKTLQFASEPDYAYLRKLLYDLFLREVKANFGPHTNYTFDSLPYDWQMTHSQRDIATSSSTTLGSGATGSSAASCGGGCGIRYHSSLAASPEHQQQQSMPASPSHINCMNFRNGNDDEVEFDDLRHDLQQRRQQQRERQQRSNAKLRRRRRKKNKNNSCIKGCTIS